MRAIVFATPLLAAVALGSPAFSGGRPNCVLNSSAASQTIVIGLTVLFGGRALPNCRNLPRHVVPVPVQSQPSSAAPSAREVRGNVFCPYPHRLSDSVFSNGAGYIIKDDVRRANGC